MAAATTPAGLERLVAARVAGTPLELLLGYAEFCGLRVAVAPGVFVPRRRSALLVEHAAALLTPGAVVLDLCCGTGAIGAALAARGQGPRGVGRGPGPGRRGLCPSQPAAGAGPRG